MLAEFNRVIEYRILYQTWMYVCKHSETTV